MAKRIAAGEMRHYIEFQRDIGVLDAYGQIEHDWQTDICMRAKIEVLRGEEGELARQVYPHATQRLTIDYHPDLNSTGVTQRRIRFGERTLHIGAVLNPDEEDIQLQLLCSEER